MDDTKMYKNIEKMLSALLYLSLEQREQKVRKGQLNHEVKAESLLNSLGFTSNEIATLTNKTQAAVIKSLQRSKGK